MPRHHTGVIDQDRDLTDFLPDPFRCQVHVLPLSHIKEPDKLRSDPSVWPWTWPLGLWLGGALWKSSAPWIGPQSPSPSEHLRELWATSCHQRVFTGRGASRAPSKSCCQGSLLALENPNQTAVCTLVNEGASPPPARGPGHRHGVLGKRHLWPPQGKS